MSAASRMDMGRKVSRSVVSTGRLEKMSAAVRGAFIRSRQDSALSSPRFSAMHKPPGHVNVPRRQPGQVRLVGQTVHKHCQPQQQDQRHHGQKDLVCCRHGWSRPSLWRMKYFRNIFAMNANFSGMKCHARFVS